MEVEFWFEFGSTYCYPAAMKVEEIARINHVPLIWKPFLLGPIFKTQGWNDSPFNLYTPKGKYMWRDLERICLDDGLKYKRPSVFPRNGLRAARVACIYSGEDWLPEFVRSVYSANFELDLDISNVDVVKECLPLSEPDASRVIAHGESSQAKDSLRENTERALQLGIFGAPSFLVGNELFWGNDRLETALRWSKT